MDFSETYKHSGPCAWSPDGKMLATAVDFRLVVRDADSLQVRLFILTSGGEIQVGFFQIEEAKSHCLKHPCLQFLSELL